MSFLRYRPGDMVGPFLLKYWLSGDTRAITVPPIWQWRFWRDWIRHGFRWEYNLQLYTLSFCIRFPIWYCHDRTTKSVNHFGMQRGPCLLVAQCIWFGSIHRRMPWQVIAYPIGKQEQLG